MTDPAGQQRPRAAFQAAMASGALHHAWLLAGPRGIGKATFARAVALRLLAEGAGEMLPPGLDVPPGHTRSLVEAGSHPDLRMLARLPKPDKGGGERPSADTDLARTITVDQVRSLLPMFATTPSLSPRRVVVIDAIDDLAKEGANALLKGLEEPPQGTIFLLVSHQPGRLLPTIRSRCRLLRFDPLDEAVLAGVLTDALPDASTTEITSLVRAGEGSPGRALGYAGLDLAALDASLAGIAADGDPSNAARLKLARELGGRGAEPRYEAFLDRAPAFIAEAARARTGPALRGALDAYEAARTVASAARPLSMVAEPTVFELAGLVARLARPGALV
ncbi:AAA family ATPase [uncultured Sphingomonas sp.]|uniref:AAA family ATPase n=1 Tax=uncultured Sphingomonas sp. TaxID=158754 RepID=UPI0035CB8235